MKSLLIKIISVLTVFTLCIGVVGCTSTSNDENCDNGHNLIQSSYTAPTCKTNGEEIYKCSRCGFESKTTLLAIDHDYQVKFTTPSTCTVKGSQTLECSICHETKTETLPLKDHNYRLVNETPSTCSIKGAKDYVCNDCSDTYSAELDLLPHTLDKINTVTCFADGELKNVCSECDYEEVIEEIDMLTHNFDADGYCTKCGIYETLIDIDDLNVSHRIHREHPWFDIFGNLTPKFKTENSIPYTYFITHPISLTTYLYDENGELLDYITTQSTINYYQGSSQYTMTLQYGGFTNGFANQFRLYYHPYYADIKVFSKETLQTAQSFKIIISCEGYKTIEKTYEIAEAQ